MNSILERSLFSEAISEDAIMTVLMTHSSLNNYYKDGYNKWAYFATYLFYTVNL